MKIRYLTSENEDIENLVTSVNKSLTDLKYLIEMPSFFMSQKSKILEEFIYTHENNVIIGRYFFNSKLQMFNLEKQIQGYCDGALYLINLEPSEIRRIDSSISSIKQENL